ncbi:MULTISPECIES: 50S ribosomal protein L15 [Fusobacterium]|uniref:50S ribosomal protein L15 n=1 Tax=Fusobacterium TaxID=848 RepID=UPI000488C549|nr:MULTISPECIES: 50S ribosomal protein L15 [Fusobacterium]MCI6151617.1 50S ribosomal protein L15 [Fusobacterium perfoetens]MDY3237785.1 50S ribosomal protein L15 [Fusobacterium perfoetens]NME36362.1 50S ribosomal protein L15 [Fusobacterium sp. FSA-380-WT-3A]
MNLNELQPSVPRKNRKRVGRGESSGWGKTAGKGSNGQKSRSGAGLKPGFEGGQMPVIRRTPKRGFSNYPFKKEYTIINLDTLNRFEEGTVVTPEILLEAGLIKKLNDGVKVLGNGVLERKVSVEAHKVSKSAQKAIEEKGGTVEIIEVKTFADVAKNNK